MSTDQRAPLAVPFAVPLACPFAVPLACPFAAPLRSFFPRDACVRPGGASHHHLQHRTDMHQHQKRCMAGCAVGLELVGGWPV